MSLLTPKIVRAATTVREAIPCLTEIELRTIARDLHPDWKSYAAAYVLFRSPHSCTTDSCECSKVPQTWARLSSPSGYSFARALLALSRAREQEIFSDPQATEFTPPNAFHLVLEVEHPTLSCVAWIDVENGKIHKTLPWRRHVDGEAVKMDGKPLERLDFR